MLPNKASSTNLQCTATEDTSELQAEINPLAHFNAQWYNDQLELQLPQLPRIADNADKAIFAPMHELNNKYTDVLAKPSKPVARDIKHQIKFLDPAKPITLHKQQRISERKL